MAETHPNTLDFDSPDFLSDPYPFYHRLRTTDPVHHSPWGDWYVSRFDDVAMVLSDRRFCGRSPVGTNPLICAEGESSAFGRMVSKWMVFMDPPEHTRLRSLVGSYFSKERVESLRTEIRNIVDGLLNNLRDAGSMEVVADFAYPLPATVISGILGMPDADHLQFRDAFRQLTRAVDEGEMADGEDAATEILTDYFRDLTAEKRRRPREDMISFLIDAQGRDDRFPEDQLLPTCILLLWAGHETTKNLIGNAVLTLLRNPEQMLELKRNPEMIHTAVEEFLRFESPVQRICRWTSTDISIGGKIIPKDQFVVGLIGAAHRDPDRFEDPDRFNIRRNVGSHLAFGLGAHRCLGNMLARMEAQIAINSLLRRMRRLELATETVEWQETTSFRSLKSLPVIFSI